MAFFVVLPLALVLLLVALAVGGFLLPGAQWLGKTVRSGASASRSVALTFDDGPCEPWTSRLLDALAGEHAQATFFVVGANVERHPDLVRRMVRDGHEVANHSYTHGPLSSLTGRLSTQVRQTEALIYETAGVSPRFVRPPYGHKTPWFLRFVRGSRGTVVMWNVEAGDWQARDAHQLARKVIDRVSPGGIVLLHDGDGAHATADRSVTVEAVPLIVRGLRVRGLRLVTLGELLGTPAYRASGRSAVPSEASQGS